MARVANVDIPDGKRIEIALRRVYGIGPTLAQRITQQANVAGNPKVREMGDDELTRIREVVDHGYVVEGDLRREVNDNIRRLIDIGSYRGVRHTAEACRSTTTHQDERAHEAGRPQDGRRQAPRDEEVADTEEQQWDEPTGPGRGGASGSCSAREGVYNVHVQQHAGVADRPHGQRALVVQRRRGRFQGLSQEHGFRCSARVGDRGPAGYGAWPAPGRGVRPRPGRRARGSHPRLAAVGDHGHEHPRRDADPPQRMPAAEAAAGVVAGRGSEGTVNEREGGRLPGQSPRRQQRQGVVRASNGKIHGTCFAGNAGGPAKSYS